MKKLLFFLTYLILNISFIYSSDFSKKKRDPAFNLALLYATIELPFITGSLYSFANAIKTIFLQKNIISVIPWASLAISYSVIVYYTLPIPLMLFLLLGDIPKEKKFNKETLKISALSFFITSVLTIGPIALCKYIFK